MMDLRALLYVTDKVFKRAEHARQKKDHDAAAEEVGAADGGWGLVGSLGGYLVSAGRLGGETVGHD